MLFIWLFVLQAFSTLSDFDQLLDHANSTDSRTFKQKYFEENEFFDEKDGIIILKIGAESSDLSPSGVSDWFRDVAQKYHAKVITIQHRFFGKSQPFSDTSIDSLQYLTTAQAIDDYGYFHDNYNQTLSNYPWLIVGGSYPGLLSAFTIKKYPQKFFAAISSAGVVFANDNLTMFDTQIAISMGHECASIARQTRMAIDDLIESDPEYLYRLFNLSQNFTKADLYFMFADIFSLGPQYGDRAHLCGALLDAHIKGSDTVVAFAKYANEVFVPKFGSLEPYSTGYLQIQSATNVSASRCWFWMTCNELGYWQTYPDRTGIRSPVLTTEHFNKQCEAVFNMNFTDIRNVDQFNKDHDITNNISHVLFTTASQDPWTWSCITQGTKMGESAQNNYINLITGEEMGHHFEFNQPEESDPPDLKRSRIRMLQVIDGWLDEFRQEHQQ